VFVAGLALGGGWWLMVDRAAPPAAAPARAEPASAAAAVVVVAPGQPAPAVTAVAPSRFQPPPASILGAASVGVPLAVAAVAPLAPVVAAVIAEPPPPPARLLPEATAGPAVAANRPATSAPAVMAQAPTAPQPTAPTVAMSALPGSAALPPAAAPSTAAPPAAALPAIAAPVAGAAALPSFDIVRVGSRGTAVVAGRAAPGATVSVLDNGAVIARVQADPSGQWVAIPAAPLPSGGQELTLAAGGDGAPETHGDTPVLLVVPDRPAIGQTAANPAPAHASQPSATQAMAVLVPPDASPRVLQKPAPEAGPADTLGLDVVDYDERGSIRFAGSGVPDSFVRLYIDDADIGEAAVDAQGHWGLAPTRPVAVGDHRLRLDDLGRAGQVMSRIEVPFQRAMLADNEVPDDHVVVQPRQNLWRIARHAYGHGVRYTLIFQANRDQIRNADLIYPGQVFVVPPPPAAAPPPSSTSSSQSR
jgi:nucleoid-associated protein YgaU